MAKRLEEFKTGFPDAWAAYAKLRDTCDGSGPLDRKVVELMKVAVSAALEHDGGVFAHVSQAKKAVVHHVREGSRRGRRPEVRIHGSDRGLILSKLQAV